MLSAVVGLLGMIRWSILEKHRRRDPCERRASVNVHSGFTAIDRTVQPWMILVVRLMRKLFIHNSIHVKFLITFHTFKCIFYGRFNVWFFLSFSRFRNIFTSPWIHKSNRIKALKSELSFSNRSIHWVMTKIGNAMAKLSLGAVSHCQRNMLETERILDDMQMLKEMCVIFYG